MLAIGTTIGTLEPSGLTAARVGVGWAAYSGVPSCRPAAGARGSRDACLPRLSQSATVPRAAGRAGLSACSTQYGG
ncbi:MAG: hypothetical protein ACRDJC_27195, partial [Thermomicrobiales bacterium]